MICSSLDPDAITSHNRAHCGTELLHVVFFFNETDTEMDMDAWSWALLEQSFYFVWKQIRTLNWELGVLAQPVLIHSGDRVN